MSILCLFYVPTSGIYNNGTLNFSLPSCILCSLLAISYVFLMFLFIFLCSGGPHACRQKFSSLLLFCASTCLQKKPWILNKRRKPNLLLWPTACFQLLFFFGHIKYLLIYVLKQANGHRIRHDRAHAKTIRNFFPGS